MLCSSLFRLRDAPVETGSLWNGLNTYENSSIVEGATGSYGHVFSCIAIEAAG
jgi:hypothetical protein